MTTNIMVLIAEVCHEINRAYCAALGDFSQRGWNYCPEWQKESAVDGVKFHLENPLEGPEASHQNWYDKKEKDGWKYGEEKDEQLKLHPCMVAFGKLPKEQQAKDYIFRQTVHSLTNFIYRGKNETN